MEKESASIFNDVIGPIMRGPSSSHTAAAYRIGSIVRQSIGKPIKVRFDFDTDGSLAKTYEGQGSDMGLTCGLLGKSLTDNGVDNFRQLAKDAGIDIEYRIYKYGAIHPNNYRIDATGEDGRHKWEAISIGGGMIEMYEYDGFRISIGGGFYELLVKFDNVDKCNFFAETISKLAHEEHYISQSDNVYLFGARFSDKPDLKALRKFAADCKAIDFVFIPPLLPTLSHAKCNVPFRTAEEMTLYNANKGLELWELAVRYESARGGASNERVFEQMAELAAIMENAIKAGLRGTEYEDRILGPQAHLIEEAQKNNRIVPCDILNNVIKMITSVMETKSSMGVIVAAPTAGSCGCLPGTIFGVGRSLGKSDDEIIRAFLASALIGVFFAEQATFAAEVGGCQVECGAGSGMAAAGVAQLMGATAQQALDAASIALQNITGLVCDTVANRVEVPCLGKNIMGGTNAIASANMAVAGFDKVIPLDETIRAMLDIGHKLPSELRCTFGGLAKTKTGYALLDRLNSQKA